MCVLRSIMQQFHTCKHWVMQQFHTCIHWVMSNQDNKIHLLKHLIVIGVKIWNLFLPFFFLERNLYCIIISLCEKNVDVWMLINGDSVLPTSIKLDLFYVADFEKKKSSEILQEKQTTCIQLPEFQLNKSQEI